MKKTCSIILAILMLISCIPVFASAATEVHFDLSRQFTAEDLLVSGTDYFIDSGVTMVVPSGLTLNVPLSSTLTVSDGASLIVNGQLNVAGDVVVDGRLGGSKITGTGDIVCKIEFPNLDDPNINLASKISVKYFISDTSDYYSDINVDLNTYTSVPSTGTNVYVDYDRYIYVRVIIAEAVGEDRYDDKLYPVYSNGTRVDFAQNACPIAVTTSNKISYGVWRTDDTYYNRYRVILPEGEGYTVYGRNGEYGEITLKYGQRFSFFVELEEEYNQSDYWVYVYNGTGWTNLDKDAILAGIEPAVPDSEGYFNINSITGDYTVIVEGVVSNKVLNIFAQVFDILKGVFEAIVEVFNEIRAMFGW